MPVNLIFVDDVNHPADKQILYMLVLHEFILIHWQKIFIMSR